MLKSPFEIPEPIKALQRIPNTAYNFKHTLIQETPVPASIVIWNLLDFGHVNFIHRKCYHHCKVLARFGKSHLLEYGVNQFFFMNLPISLRHLMWHEFVPPSTVRHISRSPWGSYTKAEVELEEFISGGKKHTRLYHSFFMHLSPALSFLRKPIQWYLEKWSEILWAEDMPMCLRRQRVLEAGFRDYPLEAEFKGAEGFLVGNEPGGSVPIDITRLSAYPK